MQKIASVVSIRACQQVSMHETVINNYYGSDDQVANNDDNSYQADADNGDYFDGMDDFDSDWV